MTTPNDERAFVLDANGTKLAPTSANKGWFLIRKGRAVLIERFPMVIQLNRIVENPICDIVLGIDDGSKYVGVAFVQKCNAKNKVVFKGVIKHRQDVKKLMCARAGYRRLRRQEKRYRPARFSNRAASKRKGRLPPSILQKRQAIMRLVNRIGKWIGIGGIILEDVAIDIRALSDSYKPYRWQYQQSNRLDENLRKAVILRDGKCMVCGKKNCVLEAHHIIPKRMSGADTLLNLITLCRDCHKGVAGDELTYADKFQKIISGKSVRFDYAQHVMQGKKWLWLQLSSVAPLCLTDGGTTANRRIDWGVEKSHSNDAVVICGLKPVAVPNKEWQIKPKRKKRKIKNAESVCGFLHGDFVCSVDTKGIKRIGYITAIYHDKAQINVQCPDKHLKRVTAKKCVFVHRCAQLSIL